METATILNYLKNCPICKTISKEAAEELIQGEKYKITHYKKGEQIARQGSPCKHLYLLITGEVTTEMVTENGGLFTIETIKAVNPLAPAFLFAEKNTFPVNVITLTDSTVLTITKETVVNLFQKDARFLQSFITYNSDKTQFITNKLQTVTFRTIRGKLANYLLELLMEYHTISPTLNTFYTDRNQTELAKLFGVSRPALARILSEFQQEGIIKSERNKVTILNKNALRELLNDSVRA